VTGGRSPAQRSNIELVRAAVAAFNRNDMDTLAALCSERFEAIPIQGWPDDPVYRGPEGMVRLSATWWENFDRTTVEIERLEGVGARVLALLVQSGWQQGVALEQRLGSIWDCGGGLIRRVQFFLGYEPALEAAGLAP
jgi:ketosteroid isomerase-like protein